MQCLRSFVFSSPSPLLLPLVLLVLQLVADGNASRGNARPRHPSVYKYSRFSSSPRSAGAMSSSPPSSSSDKIQRTIDNIEKSVGDSRIYRGLVLKNGLTALLISDPDTDKSAASLSVAVGRFFKIFLFYLFGLIARCVFQTIIFFDSNLFTPY